MASKKRYTYDLYIFWSPDDKVFVVEVPDLPGCLAHGDTPTQAAASAEEAIALWIDTARASGRAIPPPTTRRVLA